MKNLILLLFVATVCVPLHAQKVNIKKGQVFVDGSLVCLMEKGSANPQVGLMKTIELSSVDGKELWIRFLPEEVIVMGAAEIKYKMTFEGMGKETYVDVMVGAMKYYVKRLAKTGALSKNGLNADGIDQFIEEFGFKEPNNLTPSYPNNNNVQQHHNYNQQSYTIVQRNRNASVMVINGSIKQAGQDVATYQESTFSEKGKLMVQVVVNDVQGSLILTAHFPKFNSNLAHYKVSGDAHEYSVTIDENGTSNMKIKSLVKALIERGVF